MVGVLDDAPGLAERVFQWSLVLTWLGVAVATFAYSLPCYRLSLADRAAPAFFDFLGARFFLGAGGIQEVGGAGFGGTGGSRRARARPR